MPIILEKDCFLIIYYQLSYKFSNYGIYFPFLNAYQCDGINDNKSQETLKRIRILETILIEFRHNGQ